jgi:hypothetical protein
MMWRRLFLVSPVLAGIVCTCDAQSSGAPGKLSSRPEKGHASGYLVPTHTVAAGSEMATSFSHPLICDGDGNLYLQSDNYGVSGVRKLNAKAERVALFQPNANADLKIDGVGYFSVGQIGELYQLVFPHEITRYVMVFKADGSYKSSIKLQPGFAWNPSTLAVFSSGDMLISGLEYDRDRNNHAMWPFTGIFSSNGTLLKELKLEDDDALHDLASLGDARVSSPTNPWANHAVEFGHMQAASDGNT